VTAVVDRSIAEDQVRIAITLEDGRRLEKYIEHAVGSAKNPMSDAQLEVKFRGLVAGILPAARARQVMDLCWNVEKLESAAAIARSGGA